MSEIGQLEGRITAALDRIRAGMAQQRDAAMAVAAVATPVEDVSAVQALLDAEREANAQLEDRVRVLKERQDSTVTDLENRAAGHTAQLAKMETELQRVRASNAELRELTAQLRSAAADGATSPELINRATMAEVDALQAQRAAEAAEVDAIVTTLKPLIEEV